MKRITAVVLGLLLMSNAAFAGPLSDAAKAAAAQSVRAQKKAENKLLWPGIGLIAGGATLALYGFSHTTGAEVGTNSSLTSVSIKEKHATGVGVTGLAIAGVGGALVLVGQKQSRADRKVTIGFNQVTIRF